MKKLSKNQSMHEKRIANPRNTYQVVISWNENREKKYECIRVGARELDVQEKVRRIFYRIVKEKSGMILHNLQKPYEQDRHNFTSKNGTLTRKAIKAPSSLHGFEYTYCKI